MADPDHLLPEPFVPADVDLRDFPFMPLDVGRLRDSDFAALDSGDAFRAAVLLWCAAWHQQPAARVIPAKVRSGFASGITKRQQAGARPVNTGSPDVLQPAR